MAEGTQIAKAYVQILPSTKGMKSKLSEAMGGDAAAAGEEAGGKLGNGLVGKLKAVIAAAGIGTIVKQALDAGGALQQSFGGLDTLYGDASEAAKNYAREAAQAGISMNDYAEQAVSFGASLKQAFEGDVTKAADAANTAILDMADNAAKMGTPLESIQTAYQGFAKQNYTMLDNLKLGYGGTKEEMQRLLEDAQKISGVKYDMSNLGDVYSAIHVIQKDLGLTGVAAAEASETFTGSFEAMKASATNLLADISTGNTQNIYTDIETLFTSVETFVINNLGPMAANIIKAIPQVISNIMAETGDLLSQASKNTDMMLEFATNLIDDLVKSTAQSLPWLVKGVIDLISAMFTSIIEFDWGSFFNEIIEGFISYIDEGFYEIGLDGNEKFLETVANWFQNVLPEMLNNGVDMILSLITGLTETIPELIDQVAPMIASFIAAIGTHLPEIIVQGYEIITKLIIGLISAIPDIIIGVGKIIIAIVKAFGEYDWREIGRNILEGIKEGILNSIKTVVDAARRAAQSIYDAVKDFFDIGSPSKLMKNEIGRWIPAGIAVGIDANIDDVKNSMKKLTDETLSVGKISLPHYESETEFESGFAMGNTFNQTLNITTTDTSPDELARTIRLESKFGLMVGGELAFG